MYDNSCGGHRDGQICFLTLPTQGVSFTSALCPIHYLRHNWTKTIGAQSATKCNICLYYLRQKKDTVLQILCSDLVNSYLVCGNYPLKLLCQYFGSQCIWVITIGTIKLQHSKSQVTSPLWFSCPAIIGLSSKSRTLLPHLLTLSLAYAWFINIHIYRKLLHWFSTYLGIFWYSSIKLMRCQHLF